MSSEINFKNYTKICRCCVVNQGVMDIFESRIENVPLSSVILTFTNIPVSENDGFPRGICEKCAQVLGTFYKFVQTFKDAQQSIKYVYSVYRQKFITAENDSDPLFISPVENNQDNNLSLKETEDPLQIPDNPIENVNVLDVGISFPAMESLNTINMYKDYLKEETDSIIDEEMDFQEKNYEQEEDVNVLDFKQSLELDIQDGVEVNNSRPKNDICFEDIAEENDSYQENERREQNSKSDEEIYFLKTNSDNSEKEIQIDFLKPTEGRNSKQENNFLETIEENASSQEKERMIEKSLGEEIQLEFLKIIEHSLLTQKKDDNFFERVDQSIAIIEKDISSPKNLPESSEDADITFSNEVSKNQLLHRSKGNLLKKLIEVKNDKETNSNNIEWVEITSDNENLDEKDDQEDNEEIEENIDEQRDPNIDLKCFECLLVFETKEDRKEHQESTGHCMEPNHNCSICVRHLGTKKKYSSSWWEKERKNKSLCTLCGSSVLTIHLKRHMKCHEKKHYECEYCNEVFDQYVNLRSHQQSAHKSESKRSVKCPDCNKSIRYDNFKKHYMLHTGEKPYKCKECTNSYSSASSLRMHNFVHLNLKPFKCEVCGRQFRHRNSLKCHKRTHTGEKPYSCGVCSKTFSQISALKKHKKSSKHFIPLRSFEILNC